MHEQQTTQASTPDRIGRYEITGRLGTGAMAEIFRARDPDIDRVVAIKLLKHTWQEERDLERFTREARAAGALTHPNIVTVYDVGRFAGRPYLTMELLEGPTLEALMATGDLLSHRQVLELAIALARALHYAHENNVVHRDIKPSNILFAHDSLNPKIADFGIARLENGEQTLQTGGHLVIGTPRYMSPEQALGETVDRRSDLFSLGVVLFELLTGEKAFDAPTTTSLLIQIARDKPRSFRDTAGDVPMGLHQIVRKLLEKNPQRRYQTGAALADALQRELEAVIEREADAGRNRYVPLRVRWSAAMGAIVALVLGASIFTVVTIQSRVIRTQVEDAGAALARFIANEASTPLLGEDWVALESFVEEARRRDTIAYLTIFDHDGIARASTIQAQRMRRDNRETHVGDMHITDLTLSDGSPVLDFETAVQFQDTRIGHLRLGLTRSGFDSLMATTWSLMIVLGLVTAAAVVATLYVFGSLLTRPLRLLAGSMQAFGSGDWDHRPTSVRTDEIGQLYTAFNQMADAVQHQLNGGHIDVAPAPTPRKRTGTRPPDASDPEATVVLTVPK
ncbi:MAG: protein kinase [Pseudomonadales bacterium]